MTRSKGRVFYDTRFDFEDWITNKLVFSFADIGIYKSRKQS